jgi:peptide deformylase
LAPLKLNKTTWGEFRPGKDTYRSLINQMKGILDDTGYDFITSNMIGHEIPLAFIHTKGYDKGDRVTAFYPRLLWVSRASSLRRETSLTEPGTAHYFSRPNLVITKYFNRNGDVVYHLAEGKTAQVMLQAIEALAGRVLTDPKPPVETLHDLLSSRLSDEDKKVIKSKWPEKNFGF